MPFKQVSTAPYAGTIKHDATSHSSAVAPYGTAINTHTHDPGDTVGNYGASVPAWGPSNAIYSAHGPGGASTDWGSAYNAAAAIPADPSETAVNPTTGLVMSQVTPPSTITAAHGIQAHIQRLYGALALLKGITTASTTALSVQSTSVFTLQSGQGVNFRTGVPITVGTQTGNVQSIAGDQITLSAAFGTLPTAGQTVTQKTGNWWDNVSVALLGATPQQGNIALTSAYSMTAGQLISTIAAGTAPLLVTSATLVANLNAQYVGGYQAYPTSVGAAGGTIPTATAPTSGVPIAGGTLAVGTTVAYAVTFSTPQGQTTIGASSVAQTPSTGNQSVPLTNIPLGIANVTARNVYRSSGGGPWGIVQTINDNTTTSWTDTGVSAGGTPPGTSTATYAGLIPAFDNNGYLPPGYIEYDSTEAQSYDALTPGQSTLLNSLNRIRAQLAEAWTAAGAGPNWNQQPASLVQSIAAQGYSALGGLVTLTGTNGVAVTQIGQQVTISGPAGGVAANFAARYGDFWQDGVVSGLTVTTSGSSLTATIAPGTAYVLSARSTLTLATNVNLGATLDNYVDWNGGQGPASFTISGVAVNAAAPAVAANSIRLYKLTTNASGVTATVDLRTFTTTGSAIAQAAGRASLDAAGHLALAASVPSAAASAGSNVTGVSIAGNDIAGSVQFTTPATFVAGDQVTVTFGTPFLAAPKNVQLTAGPNTAATAAYTVKAGSVGTASFRITMGAAAPSTVYQFYFLVIA